MYTYLKKLISLALCLALCLSFALPAYAAEADGILEGICGENLTWTLEDGVLTISGTGAMTDFAAGTETPWYGYSESITEVTISDGVTTVGNGSFFGCTQLIEVVLPEGITMIGANAFTDCVALGKITIPGTVKSIGSSAFSNCYSLTQVVVPSSVNQIGEYCFAYCENLRSVYLLADIEEIAPQTFEGCSSLTEVSIPGSVKTICNWAFRECGSLTSIEIPEGVEEIENMAFWYCNELSEIALPKSLTDIGEAAFNGCSSLQNVNYNGTETERKSNLKIIETSQNGGGDNASILNATWHYLNSEPVEQKCGDNVFWKLDEATGILSIWGTGEMYDFSSAPWTDVRDTITAVEITEGVTSIGKNAFFRSPNLASVSIPTGIIEIRDCAFQDCDSLVNVTIPEGTKILGASVFAWSNKLRKVTIPEGVITIGKSAFNGCSSLNNVVIPGSVTKIEDYTFYECTSLSKLTISEGVQSIGKAILFYAPTSPIVIPSTVSSIDDEAFWACYHLTSITIPESVTSIGKNTFWGCSSLTTANLPEGLTSIVSGMFLMCKNLRKITIPNSVTSIGPGAFSECQWLESVTMSAGVERIEAGAFGTTCENLSDVYFYGTEEDRNKIDFTESNDALLNATWHYIVPPTIEGQCGENVFWKLDESTGALSVWGTGRMYDFNELSPAPWSDKRSAITSVEIDDGVVSIGNYAFESCTNLSSVSIPSSVEYVGHWSFDGCTSLTSITIPDGVKQIGKYSFANSGMGQIAISQTVETIGSNAFENCLSLEEIAIPDSVHGTGQEVFSGCLNLKKVTLSENIENIAPGLFKQCESLTTINIPASATFIGQNAFEQCSNLSDITISTGIESIHGYAFYGCDKLTDVYYDGSVIDRNGITFGMANEIIFNANWHYGTTINGYIAGISVAEPSISIGESAFVYVGISHDSDDTFAAGELSVSYDPSLVSFDAENSVLGNATVTDNGGILTLADYGEDKLFRDNAYLLSFNAISNGTAVFDMTSAAFVNKQNASSKDLTEATIFPRSVTLPIGQQDHLVTLPDSGIVHGNSSVADGGNYIFSVSDYQHYNYTVSATMNGETVTVIDNGNGTYTIPNVSGDLVISADRTPKSYDVTFTGNGAEDITEAAATATYGTAYTFALPTADGFAYSLDCITIGGTDYTEYKVQDGVYTIPGTAIAGDIVITVTKTSTENSVSVTVTGSGAGMAAGFAPTAQVGSAYTLTVTPSEDYSYTITATMGGEAVQLLDNGNDTYTIANVTGDIVFTIERTLLTDSVSVSQYLDLDGSILWLVKNAVTLKDGKVPTYNGANMFWSDKYDAYCYLVKANTLDEEEVKAGIDIVDGAAEAVDYSMDVNMTGKVDSSDAQLVYNMYNAMYDGFTAEVTMEKYLRADTNGDAIINVEDAAAIISEILK